MIFFFFFCNLDNLQSFFLWIHKSVVFEMSTTTVNDITHDEVMFRIKLNKNLELKLASVSCCERFIIVSTRTKKCHKNINISYELRKVIIQVETTSLPALLNISFIAIIISNNISIYKWGYS